MPRPARNRVRWLNDPMREMARWAVRRWRLGTVIVQYVDALTTGKKCLGATYFTRGRAPYIEICGEKSSLFGMLDVLAHELAHVICYRRRRGAECFGHGKHFMAARQEIFDGWKARLERRAKRCGGRVVTGNV